MTPLCLLSDGWNNKYIKKKSKDTCQARISPITSLGLTFKFKL